jgi:hypothetical protein
VPEPGPLRVGPVDLPPGKVLTSGLYGDGAPPQPVAWVTVDPVPAAGHVWQQLSGLHRETGLAPILLRTLGNHPRRPRHPWIAPRLLNSPYWTFWWD